MKTLRCISCRVFLRVCLVLFLLAVAVPDAPAQTLPGDTAVAPSAGNQLSPFIAQGGSVLLAVWSDFRSNPYGSGEYETSGDIYGMLIDSSGAPLNTVPIAIAAGPATQEHPRSAWNGSVWLVVFESYDLGGTGSYYQKSLEAVRVTPAGVVLDAKPIKIYNDTPVGMTWAVASDGAGWVVVNQGTSATGDIVASRISGDGVLLDPGPKSLVPATYYLRGGIHLAYAGGVFLLAYEESMTGSDPTAALRFDPSLAPIDPAPYNLAPAPFGWLVSNGSGFYAVWTEQLPDYSVAVKGSRIGTSGRKLDGSGVVISGASPPAAYTTTSVAWDGSYWKATWGAASGTRVARVDAGGRVLDPGGVAVDGPATGLSASAGDGSVQLVWSQFANNNYDVFTSHIAADNRAGANRALSVGTPQQLKTDIASSGNGYLLVYRSVTASESRVLAQPFDASGSPLSTGPIQLAAGPSNTGPGSPNVAWSSEAGVYLVAWGDSSGIYAQRILPGGARADASPFRVMSPAFGPADVAAAGGTFLVTGRYQPTHEIVSVIAARVRGSDGAILDPGPMVLGGTFVAYPPAVTALGGRFFVAFHSNASHDNSYAATMGVFVPVTGANLPAFVVYSFSTGGGNGIFEIGLASDGNQAILVQSAEITSGVENDLLARMITADGSLGPVINLTPWAGNQYRPRASFDGKNFIVVYQDQKNRLSQWSLEQLDARSDIFGMRISPAGTILDPQGFLLSASPVGETDPAVVSAKGVSLIAMSSMMNDAVHASYRIKYSLLDASVNDWPVAVATAAPAGGDVPVTVSFSSAGSTDLDGAIADYRWDFGDGTSSPSPHPSHAYTEAGPYVATLTVMDNAGASTSQTVLVNAVAPNRQPVAVASASPAAGSAPLDVVLSASGSYDPDGFVGNIEWRFSDGGTYWGSTAYHTFTTVGDHTATLIVYDGRGGTGSATLTIRVGSVNQPPVANASAIPAGGAAPLTVQFSSSGSYDPDGSIKACQWTFGDAFGYSSTDPNPSYTYNYAGTYTATLTITDNNNVSSTDTVVIEVSQAPATVLRSTAIGLSAKLTGKKVVVVGQVTVRDGKGAAVSGASVTAQWTRPDGSVVTQTASTGRSGIAQFPMSGGQGTYTLAVMDIAKYQYSFDAAGSVLSKSISITR